MPPPATAGAAGGLPNPPTNRPGESLRPAAVRKYPWSNKSQRAEGRGEPSQPNGGVAGNLTTSGVRAQRVDAPARVTRTVPIRLRRPTTNPRGGGRKRKGPCHLIDGDTGAGGPISPSTPRATLELSPRRRGARLVGADGRGKSAPSVACSRILNNNVNNNLEKAGRSVGTLLHMSQAWRMLRAPPRSSMSRQEGRPSQRTLPIPPSVAQTHASPTHVLLSLAGDDERLEGGPARGQELLVIIFPPVAEFVRRFSRMAGAEDCRERVYVKPAPL